MANGIVLGGALNCRTAASTNANSLGRFSNGTVLSVSSVSGNAEWYRTTWTNGTTGYVMSHYVACVNDTVKVNSNDVNVRTGPSTGYDALYQMDSGSTATVIGMTTNWVNICGAGNISAWIHADYVDKYTSSNTGGGSTGSVTDDGSTGDSTNLYTGAKCVENETVRVYERDNSIDLVVLQYHGVLQGYLNVRDVGDTKWLDYAADGKVYRSQVDITYCKKPASVTMGSGTLRSGSTGRYVYHLQHYLNRYLEKQKYTKIAVDGSFGSNTKAKVESFQQYWNKNYSVKLDVDGVVGPNTRNALAQYVHGLTS